AALASGDVNETRDVYAASTSAASSPPPVGYGFSVGTWFARFQGSFGTAFALDSPSASNLVVGVTGPSGWNNGASYSCGDYIPPGATPDRALCWTPTAARPGSYSALAQPGSASTANETATLEAGAADPGVKITDGSIGNTTATVTWTVGSAQSFLVRLSPVPFTGTITHEE